MDGMKPARKKQAPKKPVEDAHSYDSYDYDDEPAHAAPRRDEYSSHNASGGLGIGGTILLIGLCWWGYNNWVKSDTWTAYIYKNSSYSQSSTATFKDLGSLDECLDQVDAYRLIGGDYYEHECGKNCKPSKDFASIDVCEETY